MGSPAIRSSGASSSLTRALGIEAVFDAGPGIGTVELGGEVGNIRYDPGSGRILVDVQSKSELAVIDPRRQRVVRRVLVYFPLEGGADGRP